MRRTFLVAFILVLAASAVLLIRQATAHQCVIVGVVLMVVALPPLVLSRLQLGNAFSVAPRATTLVTKGLYSKIPHPMYVFLDLVLLGVVLSLHNQWLVAAWLGLVAIQTWQARREAEVLDRTFGEAYRTYRAQAWW